jgi:pyrroline-5-carboxylate reductase
MMRACSHAVAHVTARASAKATRRCSRSTTRRAFVSASLSSDDADAPEKAKRRTLGFVGAGSMAEAMAKGFVSGGVAKFEDIAVSHSGNPLTAKRWRDLGVSVFTSNVDVLNKCDTVFLAVKPHVLPSVLREVVDSVDIERHLFVSVAAGVPSNFIEDGLSCSKRLNSKENEGKTKTTPRVIRVMPNTPCLVNAAASGISRGSHSTTEDMIYVNSLMQACGLSVQVEEKLMNAVVGVSGSGPAYGFLFIEALADGGVAAGLPRDVALKLAAQTLLGTYFPINTFRLCDCPYDTDTLFFIVQGAAKMVIETGEHPGVLKDKVCSPGGTTIQAVRTLEANGFRSAVIEAVLASAARSEALGKGK